MSDRSIALIACSKRKVEAAKPVPAFELYQGQLFRAQLKYALDVLNLPLQRIFILSAKHGIVWSRALLTPYDQTLIRMSAPERRQWGMRVAYHLGILAGMSREPGEPHYLEEVFVLGGKLYREPVISALHASPTTVTTPHPNGLGYAQQVEWYKEQKQ